MKSLISIDDIATYRPMSKGIPFDRINPFIQESQDLEVCSVLGDPLYTDLLAKFNVTTDPLYAIYRDLLYGKTYTPQGEVGPIQYKGIVPMLVYFSLARFFVNNPINITKYGIVAKNNEYSEALDQATITNAVNELKSIGVAYQHKVIKFLQDNASAYTLYKGNQVPLHSNGLSFFDV